MIKLYLRNTASKRQILDFNLSILALNLILFPFHFEILNCARYSSSPLHLQRQLFSPHYFYFFFFFFAVTAKMFFIFLFFPITFLSLFLHCHPQLEVWRESLSPVPGIQFSFATSPVSCPLFHWFTNPLSLLPWGHLRALPLCFYHSLTSCSHICTWLWYFCFISKDLP